MTSEPVAETINGRLRGALANGVLTFKGVPYARADRFMPPRPAESWVGIRDAVQFGASAPQTNPDPPPGPPYVITAQIPPPPGAPPPLRLVESEDCQYLNVWTSGLNDGRKRPVMVWLHGGFFYAGSGSTVDGSKLAARGDVVVVSINHRLNAFGFSHLADLGGAEFAHSGNAGMLDIIAALEWVRDNIAGFGGDPDRVMVFGASGGGMKTGFLMASPSTRGLIHRTGGQSGPALRFMERSDASTATAMLLAELGLGESRANDLALVPMVDLLRAYHKVAARLKADRFIHLPCFSPVIDPELLPRHPFSPDAAPQTRDIPMLIGWNAQEMSFFLGNDPEAFTLDDEGLALRAEQMLGTQAMLGGNVAGILELYRQRHPQASASQRYIQLYSDYSLMLPTLAQADRKAALGGAPTYAYRFDFPTPALDGKLGAMHTLEASFVFDTTEAAPHLTGGTPQAAALAQTMSSAWVNFAVTGNPNGEGVPEWPAYDPATAPLMLLGDAPSASPNPAAAERQALAPFLNW